MPNYIIYYTIKEHFTVHVEAVDEQEALDMLKESVSPAFDVGGFEPEWFDSNIDYDDVDVVIEDQKLVFP